MLLRILIEVFPLWYYNENMSQSTEKQLIELQTVTGEYLAMGFTNGEIIDALMLQQQLTEEEANEILRGVYNSWISVREGLNLQAEDERNWHQHLRMKLLQDAIKDVSTPSRRLALSILDSIAGIQGISTMPEHIVPLSIELIEKKAEPEPEDKSAPKVEKESL